VSARLASEPVSRGRRKEEGGRRKEEGGRRKEEGGRRKEEGGRRKEEGRRRKAQSQQTLSTDTLIAKHNTPTQKFAYRSPKILW
jgi:hypothetical protein